MWLIAHTDVFQALLSARRGPCRTALNGQAENGPAPLPQQYRAIQAPQHPCSRPARCEASVYPATASKQTRTQVQRTSATVSGGHVAHAVARLLKRKARRYGRSRPNCRSLYSMSSLKRTLRAVKIAATDRRIPRPLRGLAALGLAPIPGPFDEALLLIVAIPLVLFYREPLADAWRQANTARPS